MPKTGDMLCGHQYTSLVESKGVTYYCWECEREAIASARAFEESRKEQETLEKAKTKGHAHAVEDS